MSNGENGCTSQFIPNLLNQKQNVPQCNYNNNQLLNNMMLLSQNMYNPQEIFNMCNQNQMNGNNMFNSFLNEKRFRESNQQPNNFLINQAVTSQNVNMFPRDNLGTNFLNSCSNFWVNQ